MFNPSREDFEEAAQRFYAELESCPRFPFFVDRKWLKPFSGEEAGVYLIWDKRSGELVYVGETENIKKRMKNIRQSKNHACRQTVRKLECENDPDEKRVKRFFQDHLQVSFKAVTCGRKELEAYIDGRLNPKYNKGGRLQ